MPVNPASIDAVSLSQRPSGGAVWVVIDTDAADEIDDQFAVAYALLSPERIEQVSCPEPTSFLSVAPGDTVDRPPWC